MSILNKQEAKPTRPRTLRDVSPKFAAVSDKAAALCKQEEELGAKIWPLAQKLSKARAFRALEAHTPRRPIDAPKPIEASSGAAALLGDLTPPPRMPPTFALPSRHSDLPELHRLGAEVEAVREAINLLTVAPPGERLSVIERERILASELLCNELRPEYDAVAGAYADALLAFTKALVTHEEFVKQRLTGVAWASLRAVRMPALNGNPATDPTCELRQLIDWCIETGHLDIKKVPVDWNKHRSRTAGEDARRSEEISRIVKEQDAQIDKRENRTHLRYNAETRSFFE